MHNCCYSQNINFNKNFTFQVRKIKLHTIIGQGLTGELLSTFVKTDTICSRLKELSAGTSAGQQSNGGAGQQSKEIVGSYTDTGTSTVASSLADKDSHNNKQLWSKRAAEASDTGHQWACRDVLETIEAIPYHEVFIHSFGDYDTRGL